MAILAFDVETKRLAEEVATEYASELDGSSPWERPDLFGFAVGVAVDVDTGEARRYGPGEAFDMLEALRNAERTVGYNSASFDLGVLAADGDVEAIRSRHVDLCSLVRDALAKLPEAQRVDRLRQGGLDGLAKANGLLGKTGSGADAPTLFREGRVDELLHYCEVDVRLVCDLYRMARDSGALRVDAYHRDDNRSRIYLPRATIPITL